MKVRNRLAAGAENRPRRLTSPPPRRVSDVNDVDLAVVASRSRVVVLRRITTGFMAAFSLLGTAGVALAQTPAAAPPDTNASQVQLVPSAPPVVRHHRKGQHKIHPDQSHTHTKSQPPPPGATPPAAAPANRTDDDDTPIDAQKGVDAGDYLDAPDYFNGAFLRAEQNRDYKVFGPTFTTTLGSNISAGVEFGGARLMIRNDLHLNVGGDQFEGGGHGPAGQVEGDETGGVNLVRGNIHASGSLAGGQTTWEAGVRGYLNGTTEVDGVVRESTTPTAEAPNGLTFSHQETVGGNGELYGKVSTQNSLGTLAAEVHIGANYHLWTQGNLYAAPPVSPNFYSIQSYQPPNSQWTLTTREDSRPAEHYSAEQMGVEHPIKMAGQDATFGVYTGHQDQNGHKAITAGVGLTFEF